MKRAKSLQDSTVSIASERHADHYLCAAAPDLLAALEALYDVQNGCPLHKYEAKWNAAMLATVAALGKARNG